MVRVAEAAGTKVPGRRGTGYLFEGLNDGRGGYSVMGGRTGAQTLHFGGARKS